MQAVRAILVALALLPCAAPRSADADRAAAPPPRPDATLEVFVAEGCSRCEDAGRYLSRLQRERPGLTVVIRDVRNEAAALERLRSLALAAGVPTPGVPAFHVHGELIIGFEGETSTGTRLVAALDRGAASAPTASASPEQCALEPTGRCEAEAPAELDGVELPWAGTRLTVGDLGLPLFTVVIGLLDGFNPCSMWVLVLMVSMLAGLGDRRRMALVAGTFVAIEGVAYFAFLAAWLNLFLLIGISRVSELALGAIAIAAGALHLKDVVALGRGVSLSIPAAAKPGIYSRMRAILHAQRLPAALVGAVVLAVFVQIVELLCTSGFPALYTRILTRAGLDSGSYYGHLLLYIAMYMLDDVLVLAIGLVTLSQRRLQENEGRWLKLVSGLVMVGLGIHLIASAL